MVNFDFLDRRSAERFAELLDDSTGNRRPSHSQADERLAELVAVGHSLAAARPGIHVDPEFRVGLRAMLVATADRHGLGRTASPIEVDPLTGQAPAAVPAGRGGLRGTILGHGGRRIRARGAIVIGVAAGAMAVSGISAASENASPGDVFYGVKRSTERAQLAMAGSDVSRGQLSLDFARTRLAEAASMPGQAIRFIRVLNDMDVDTSKGVKLLDTSAVARHDVRPLTTVETFVTEQRHLLEPKLDKLSPANRERALVSLSLLDRVRERTADLRAGLSCTPAVAVGADDLGPKLRDCRSTSGGAATSRQTGRSGKTAPKTGNRNATVPQKRNAPTATPTPTPTVKPAHKGTSTVPDNPAVTVPPTTTAPEKIPKVTDLDLGDLLGDQFAD